jgi:hypothetical protein
LADDVQRNLEISERATGDTREDSVDVVACELVTPEVEASACEAAWVLEKTNGDGPDVRDGDLREQSRRWERRGVWSITLPGPLVHEWPPLPRMRSQTNFRIAIHY